MGRVSDYINQGDTDSTSPWVVRPFCHGTGEFRQYGRTTDLTSSRDVGPFSVEPVGFLNTRGSRT